MDHLEGGRVAPSVSVIMSNYRGVAHLGAAIESVLAQSLGDLELIIVDDCSGDGSLAIIESYRQRDERVRLIALEVNLGPAGARNRGIAAAHGDWLAIVDNDDLIHPDRLWLLRHAAIRDGADIAADDILIFYEDGPQIGTMLAEETAHPEWIGLSAFIRSNAIYGPRAALGYCKPLIRRQALGDVRYDESLRIGEDAKLLVELLVAGCRFRIYPWLTYFYRKHGRSISHRLSGAHTQSLIRSEGDLMRAHAALGPEVVAAHAAVLASLTRAAAFAALIDGLKTRSPVRVLRAIGSAPTALLLLRLPIQAFVQRGLRQRAMRIHPDRQTPALLVLRHGEDITAPSGVAEQHAHLAQRFRERGYAISNEAVGPEELGSSLLPRADCLRVARHMRVRGNAILTGETLAPALRPYLIDGDSPMLEVTSSGVRVHRSHAAEETGAPCPLLSPEVNSLPQPITDEPLPGKDGTLLITGSRTAIDYVGLRWFLSSVWPQVQSHYPAAILTVCGSLARGTIPLPSGVVRADPGAALLRAAGLVVMPSTIRSGPAPHLIEALRHGKTIVATRTALGGLPVSVGAAIGGVETADAMAARIIELLAAPDRRTDLARAVLPLLGSSPPEECSSDPWADFLSPIPQPTAEINPMRMPFPETNPTYGPVREGH